MNTILKARVNDVDIEYEWTYGEPRPKSAENMVALINYGIRRWNLWVARTGWNNPIERNQERRIITTTLRLTTKKGKSSVRRQIADIS